MIIAYAVWAWRVVKFWVSPLTCFVALTTLETEDFYRDIAGDVETWIDTSEFDAGYPSGIQTGVNKKVIGMMKDEAGWKIIQEFIGLRTKLYHFKMWKDSSEHMR